MSGTITFKGEGGPGDSSALTIDDSVALFSDTTDLTEDLSLNHGSITIENGVNPLGTIIAAAKILGNLEPLPEVDMTLFANPDCTGDALDVEFTDKDGTVSFISLTTGKTYSVMQAEAPGWTSFSPGCQDVFLPDFDPEDFDIEVDLFVPRTDGINVAAIRSIEELLGDGASRIVFGYGNGTAEMKRLNAPDPNSVVDDIDIEFTKMDLTWHSVDEPSESVSTGSAFFESGGIMEAGFHRRRARGCRPPQLIL